MTDVRGALMLAPVVPVLTIRRAEDAVPLARALLQGGLQVMEITLRTPVALEAIRRVAGEVEGAVVAAGTVLNGDDVKRAAEAGATMAFSPGIGPFVQDAALPVCAGVATASEIMLGLSLGLDTFKFFPAASSGGIAALSAFAGPFPDVRFCPTGGIGPANAHEFLSLKTVLCVGGSWVAPAASVALGDWEAITRLARDAAALHRAAAP